MNSEKLSGKIKGCSSGEPESFVGYLNLVLLHTRFLERIEIEQSMAYVVVHIEPPYEGIQNSTFSSYIIVIQINLELISAFSQH